MLDANGIEPGSSPVSVDSYHRAAVSFAGILGDNRLIYLKPVAGSHQKAAITLSRPVGVSDILAAWSGSTDEIGFLLDAPRFVVLDIDPPDPAGTIAPDRCRAIAQLIADRIGIGAISVGHYTRRGFHLLVFPQGPSEARCALSLHGAIVAGHRVERLARGRLPGQGGRGGFLVAHSDRGCPARSLTHRELIERVLPELANISLLDPGTYLQVRNSRTVQGNPGVQAGDHRARVSALESQPLVQGQTYEGARHWGRIATTQGWTYDQMASAIRDAVADEWHERFDGIRAERRRKGIAQQVIDLAATTYQPPGDWKPSIVPASDRVDAMLAFITGQCSIPWGDYGIGPRKLSMYLRGACAHIARMVTMKIRAASIGYVMLANTIGMDPDKATSGSRPLRNTRAILNAIIDHLDLGCIVRTAVRGKHGDIVMITRPWRVRLRQVLGFVTIDDWNDLRTRDGWYVPGFAIPHAVTDIEIAAMAGATRQNHPQTTENRADEKDQTGRRQAKEANEIRPRSTQESAPAKEGERRPASRGDDARGEGSSGPLAARARLRTYGTGWTGLDPRTGRGQADRGTAHARHGPGTPGRRPWLPGRSLPRAPGEHCPASRHDSDTRRGRR